MTPSGSPYSRNTLSVAAVTVDRSASITSARPTRKPASLGQSAGDASSIALSVASYGLLIGHAPCCGPRPCTADYTARPSPSAAGRQKNNGGAVAMGGVSCDNSGRGSSADDADSTDEQ